MDRRTAIEIFLAHSKQARYTVNRITKWDPSKTLKENAESVGGSPKAAMMMGWVYKLPYANRKRGRRGTVLAARSNGRPRA